MHHASCIHTQYDKPNLDLLVWHAYNRGSELMRPLQMLILKLPSWKDCARVHSIKWCRRFNKTAKMTERPALTTSPCKGLKNAPSYHHWRFSDWAFLLREGKSAHSTWCLSVVRAPQTQGSQILQVWTTLLSSAVTTPCIQGARLRCKDDVSPQHQTAPLRSSVNLQQKIPQKCPQGVQEYR